MPVYRIPFGALAAMSFLLMAGCDAAKQATVQSLTNPPAGKKTYLSPQEWTLSDQSKLSVVVELVETTDGNGSFGSMVITHTPAATPLKSLEFAFASDQNLQATPAWESFFSPGPPVAGASAPQIFRQPFSAPGGSKILFRVHIGEQPEVLAPWTLNFGDE